MSNLELRIPFGIGERLQEILFRDGPHEYVAFGLITHAQVGDRELLLTRDIVSLPDDAYIDARKYGAAWHGRAILPIIERAMAERLGILIFHAHPHRGIPRLSLDDRESAARLLPLFQQRVPFRPHGSIVFSRDGVAGSILMPGTSGFKQVVQARWFGRAVIDWPRGDASEPADSPGQNQALVIGGGSHARLRQARVAVVGLSGGGSHVVQQLAHLGIGEIILIDADTLEEKHRCRVVGVTDGDIKRQCPKAEVMERLVRQLVAGSQVRVVQSLVPSPDAVRAILDTDVVIGCVDNLHARVDLQELALRFVIPYIDIGVSIRSVENRTGTEDPLVTIGGNVITFVPGGFCLWCCGFLSEAKLGEELAGPNRGYFQNRNSEGQVISLNGLVASQGVTEVLQLLTGFAGSGIRKTDLLAPDGITQRGYKKLNGIAGTLHEWGSRQNPACRYCGPTLALGSVSW